MSMFVEETTEKISIGLKQLSLRTHQVCPEWELIQIRNVILTTSVGQCYYKKYAEIGW